MEYKDFFDILVELLKIGVIPKMLFLQRLQVGRQEKLQVLHILLLSFYELRENLEQNINFNYDLIDY